MVAAEHNKHPNNQADESSEAKKTSENTESENLEIKDLAKQFMEQQKEEEQSQAEDETEAQATATNALETEIADLKDQLLRAIAEAENVRRRARQQVEDASKYAVSNFAKDLINVLENLSRASESIPEEKIQEDELVKSINEGIDLTKNELMNVFEKYGINRIFPVGEKFNHSYHQAIAHIPDATHEPDTVLQVMQAGYILKDRLLRPAMVVVSKGAE